jgi:type VI secretion system FHA domain protein
MPGTQRDDSLEIRAAFSPPVPSFNEPKQPVAAAPARPAPLARDKDSSMLVSWNTPDRSEQGDEIKMVIVPSPRATPAVEARAHEARNDAPATQDQPARVAAASPPRLDPDGSKTRSNDELLRAFLSGLGTTDVEFRESLTPHTMQLIGQLLRASTQGVLDLLLARSLIKSELHAARTVIVAQGNNPLKFSPTVEEALSHLLAPRGQGFMSPVAAMTDACNDLRAHEFAVMAGMRAALEGVLRRFDPARLEQRLTDKGLLDSMIPMNRKAKMWGLFSELYAEITSEAQDDFDTLFGKEFLRAYESQLEKLDPSKRDGKPSDKS